MSNTYILYNNPKHNFKGLRNSIFIFDYDDLLMDNVNLNDVFCRMKQVLEKASVESDYIVMNGPSYLPSLAGLIWFTMPNRQNSMIISYCNKSKGFVKNSQPFNFNT